MTSALSNGFPGLALVNASWLPGWHQIQISPCWAFLIHSDKRTSRMAGSHWLQEYSPAPSSEFVQSTILAC